jgi:hypothetical protein
MSEPTSVHMYQPYISSQLKLQSLSFEVSWRPEVLVF